MIVTTKTTVEMELQATSSRVVPVTMPHQARNSSSSAGLLTPVRILLKTKLRIWRKASEVSIRAKTRIKETHTDSSHLVQLVKFPKKVWRLFLSFNQCLWSEKEVLLVDLSSKVIQIIQTRQFQYLQLQVLGTNLNNGNVLQVVKRNQIKH